MLNSRSIYWPIHFSQWISYTISYEVIYQFQYLIKFFKIEIISLYFFFTNPIKKLELYDTHICPSTHRKWAWKAGKRYSQRHLVAVSCTNFRMRSRRFPRSAHSPLQSICAVSFQTNKWKRKFTLSLPYTKYTLLVSLLIIRSWDFYRTIISWLRLENISLTSKKVNGKGNLPWVYSSCATTVHYYA